MSSYYPSFSYTAPNGKKYNSYKDKHLVVVHFESGDDGEMDTFLGMDPVYTDNAYGTRRFDYGAKYKDVAVIRISVMKADGKDFTVSEVRDFLRWTTGSRKTSYLDLLDGEIVKASFLGRITSVYQQKLDARTVGFVIEHTSVSPYAYSPIRYINHMFKQKLAIDSDGVLFGYGQELSVDDYGVLNNGSGSTFNIIDNGVMHIDNSVNFVIQNDTDDLSDYVYLDMKFINLTCDYIMIKNQTLYNESDGRDGITEITEMRNNEVITLSSGQFIASSSNKIFGNTFNFVWPKLLPGDNNFIISGSGEGVIEFTYRTPMKIGDCAIDIDVSGGGLCCGDNYDGPISNQITWDDILGKPSTIEGYGITDAYTIYEVDNKINNIDVNINEEDLNEMLKDVLE